MRKMLAPVFALVIALSLAACGGNNDPDPSGSAPGSSQEQEEPASRRGEEGSRPSATESPSEGGGWNQAEYAEYTNGVPEPAFRYTITGVIGNMGLSFKSDASAGEFAAWRQGLLNIGFEENSVAGETWTVFNDTHSIAHSGGGYFNIQTK